MIFFKANHFTRRQLHISKCLLPGLLFAVSPILSQALPVAYSLDSLIQYDSEIRSRNEGLDDLQLQLQARVKSESLLGPFLVHAAIGGTAIQFHENSEFDREAFIAGLQLVPKASLRNDRITISGDLSFDSYTESNPYIGDLISSDQLKGSAKLSYIPNSRVNTFITADYVRTSPDSAPYNDQTVKQVASGLEFGLAREAKVYSTLQLQTNRISGRPYPTTHSHLIQVGWTGKLGERARVLLSVGAQAYEKVGLGTSTSPYYESSLTWEPNPSSRLTIRATQGLSVFIDNSVNKETRIEIRAMRTINSRWSANLIGFYSKDRLNRYPTTNREDKSKGIGGELQCQLSKTTFISIFMNAVDRSSDQDLYTYDRLISGLRLTLEW